MLRGRKRKLPLNFKPIPWVHTDEEESQDEQGGDPNVPEPRPRTHASSDEEPRIRRTRPASSGTPDIDHVPEREEIIEDEDEDEDEEQREDDADADPEILGEEGLSDEGKLFLFYLFFFF